MITGWPDNRTEDRAATPDRLDRLLGYWDSVPGGAATARRLAAQRAAIAGLALPAEAPSGEEEAEGGLLPVAATMPPPEAGPEDIGLYAYPAWSAAFISAMAQRAGLPGADLTPSARHARYIDGILARAAADPEGAAFLPHAPEERAPRPGDLLCTDRSAAPLWHWTQRLEETGRPRPMHCDVVVRTKPGTIDMIGGNVQDHVALRRIPADEAGRVLPTPPGRPPFVLHLAAREGG